MSEAGTLSHGKVIGTELDRGWAAAGFFLVVNNFTQAAVLKHDALTGLDAIDAAFKDAGHNDVRAVCAGVVDACVAMLAETDFDFSSTGATDEDAEVGSEDDVRVTPGSEAGFKRAAVDGDHEAWNFACWDG